MQELHCFIGKDRSLLKTIKQHIPNVREYSDVMQAIDSFQEELPHILYLDVNAFGRKALRFLASIKQAFPAANIPVLALVVGNQNLPPNVEQALFEQCGVLQGEAISKRFHEFSEMLLSEHYYEINEDDPHPHGLEKIAQIWRSGKNGTITLLETNETTNISNGGIVEFDATEIIKKCIYGADFSFQPHQDKGYGDWISVGELLWEAALKITKPGFLRNRKHLALTELKNANRAEENITDLTKEILNSPPSQSINSILQQKKIRLSQIEADLEALYLLGLYGFSRLKNKSQSTLLTAVEPSNESESKINEYLHKLLAQDLSLQILAQTQRSSGGATAYIKYQQAKLQHALEGNLTTTTKRLAHKVSQKLDHTIQIWRVLSQVYRFYKINPKGNGEQAFCSGMSHLDNGNIKQAYSLFVYSLSEDPSSLHKQIFVSWASFLNDKEQANNSHKEISLSHKCRPGFVLTEVFIIALLIYLGKREEALKTFDALLKNATPSAKLLALYKIVESKKTIDFQKLHRLIGD